MPNDLFIITKELFDRIPDKDKLHDAKTFHGDSSKKKFFSSGFNNVRCAVSKENAIKLGILWLRNSGSFAYVTRVHRIEKGDIICYGLDNYTLDACVARESFILIPDKVNELPLSEFKDALQLLCDDIDNDIIKAGRGKFLPHFNCSKNNNIPESYKTVWLGIRGYFIKSDGQINRDQINKVIEGLPEFNIRVYPTVCNQSGWMAAAFEFHYKDRAYKIAF